MVLITRSVSNIRASIGRPLRRPLGVHWTSNGRPMDAVPLRHNPIKMSRNDFVFCESWPRHIFSSRNQHYSLMLHRYRVNPNDGLACTPACKPQPRSARNNWMHTVASSTIPLRHAHIGPTGLWGHRKYKKKPPCRVRAAHLGCTKTLSGKPAWRGLLLLLWLLLLLLLLLLCCLLLLFVVCLLFAVCCFVVALFLCCC